MNSNYFLEAAEKIADLADEYSYNNQLSCILRAGASKLMEKSGSYTISIPTQEELKLTVNE